MGLYENVSGFVDDIFAKFDKSSKTTAQVLNEHKIEAKSNMSKMLEKFDDKDVTEVKHLGDSYSTPMMSYSDRMDYLGKPSLKELFAKPGSKYTVTNLAEQTVVKEISSNTESNDLARSYRTMVETIQHFNDESFISDNSADIVESMPETNEYINSDAFKQQMISYNEMKKHAPSIDVAKMERSIAEGLYSNMATDIANNSVELLKNTDFAEIGQKLNDGFANKVMNLSDEDFSKLLLDEDLVRFENTYACINSESFAKSMQTFNRLKEYGPTDACNQQSRAIRQTVATALGNDIETMVVSKSAEMTDEQWAEMGEDFKKDFMEKMDSFLDKNLGYSNRRIPLVSIRDHDYNYDLSPIPDSPDTHLSDSDFNFI